MKTNISIERFAQTIHSKYGISSISYGYNAMSETYIVYIDDEDLMRDEHFLLDVFNFTHSQAEKGEWIIFVSPSDNINFNDYHPIVWEFASESAFADSVFGMIDIVDTKDGWTTSDVSGFVNNRDKFEYLEEGVKYTLAA